MATGKIMQFLKNRYVITEADADREVTHTENTVEEATTEAPVAEIEEEEKTQDKESLTHAESAQTYGWWVLIDDKRVASLEFRGVLEATVHLYAVTVLDDRFFDINLDPAKWATPLVILQSRYAVDYKKVGLEMAPVGDDMIVVQHLSIPEENLNRQADKVSAFQASLIAKAQHTDDAVS